MEPDSTTTLQTFNFEANEVRTITINDEPWFVATDVCKVLNIQNATQAVNRLDEDERSMFNIGRQGEVATVNESGLYSLILTSRKPQARKFKRWITHEVLPTIRKTGTYSVAPQPAPLARPLTSYLPLVTEMARLAQGSQTLATIAPFAQALREEIWVEVMGQLQTDEASRWRALVALLTALQPPALSDPKARANRMLQMERSLPALDTLPHEEAEDMMVLWVMRYVTHPDTHPDAGRLWKDVMKLLRTGHLEGLAGKGGAR